MSNQQGQPQESMGYTLADGTEVNVPIYRVNMPDMFVALQPPEALPYIMAPRECHPQQVIDFFVQVVGEVEEMRVDMLKRFSKSKNLKCRYKTGDVAYVMGRPFQLRVYPLNESRQHMRSGSRGRVTPKFALSPAISLLTLYIAHPGNYDEGKLAFDSYARGVVLQNASGIVSMIYEQLEIPGEPPTPRVRNLKGKWASLEGNTLWISENLLPYPPDCLMYSIWQAVEGKSELHKMVKGAKLAALLPGWEPARALLADKECLYARQR